MIMLIFLLYFRFKTDWNTRSIILIIAIRKFREIRSGKIFTLYRKTNHEKNPEKSQARKIKIKMVINDSEKNTPPLSLGFLRRYLETHSKQSQSTICRSKFTTIMDKTFERNSFHVKQNATRKTNFYFSGVFCQY